MMALRMTDLLQRSIWFHVMLFVGAYSGFLAYFHFTASPTTVSVGFASASVSEERRTLRGAASSLWQTATTAIPVVPTREVAMTNETRGNLVAVNSMDAQQTEQAQQQQQLAEQSLRATTVGDPQQRAAAIDLLGVATPETLQALRIAATADAESRNRIRAINMLGTMTGDTDRQTVLQILELARLDTDPRVAARATATYESLIAEQDVAVDR